MTRLGKLNWIWSAVALALILLGLVLSRTVIDPGALNLADIMGSGGSAWLAVPVTIALFIALAFVGMPQWVLIGAAVLTFGPVLGSLISWAATLISALCNFALGKAMGGERLRARLGERAGKWVDRVSDEGLMAALLVRLVPVAPFVLINLAAGASTMRARDFAIGTAIGIIPKIVAIALFGKGVVEILRGNNLALALGLLALGLLVLGWLVWMRRKSKAAQMHQNTPASETSP